LPPAACRYCPVRWCHVLNFCANNYLGLADDARLIDAAKRGLDEYGYGCASVRFICGTQQVHKDLEQAISGFLGTDDTILYSSCFDANGGVFETLLGEEDAVISDELNHASIIDGVRLCKAKRFRYKNNDMADLEAQLIAAEAAGARFKLIVTDGVFSMDGIIADLKTLCEVAGRHGAIVMVDDSHAVGFIGENGAGTPELCGVADKVDIYTGTLGKALGGASGGYVSARSPSSTCCVSVRALSVLQQPGPGHCRRQPGSAEADPVRRPAAARPAQAQCRAVPQRNVRRRFHPGAGPASHHSGDAGRCPSGW
jgi:7-keto-8-aminopelargonate synthetase-like enzyme